MITVETDSVLANAIWNALTGRQAHLARGNELAKSFDPEFTRLAAVKEETAECFRALHQQMQSGHSFILRTKNAWPRGFDEGFEVAEFGGLQMVCEKLEHDEKTQDRLRGLSLVKLEAPDVPEMIALAKLTKPGPFGSRTIEFGNFYGIKDGGRLVAMAGQRMMCGQSFDEVSGVCTHPDFGGRGYARALVAKVAQLILEIGHVPFLHVRADNVGAVGLYKSMGFVRIEPVKFAFFKKL